VRDDLVDRVGGFLFCAMFVYLVVEGIGRVIARILR
jgi:hypothetical protein